jgi:hypothetical protein
VCVYNCDKSNLLILILIMARIKQTTRNKNNNGGVKSSGVKSSASNVYRPIFRTEPIDEPIKLPPVICAVVLQEQFENISL